MARSSWSLSPAETTTGTQERLRELCSLLVQAGAGPFDLTRRSSEGPDEPERLVHGWALGGGTVGDQRQAAATLILRLFNAEVEIDSLCAEILDRSEEASLVYRISGGIAATCGESAIARLIVIEAARSLQARTAELWLRVSDELVLAAAVPPDGPAPRRLQEQGPLAAAGERRPWLREAGPGSESIVAVPLPGPECEALGVLVLRGREDGRSFTSGDIKLLATVAALASAFIRSDRLVQESRQAEDRERRRIQAQEVRSGLLPSGLPTFDGLDIAGETRAAETASGDYYGYIPSLGGGLWLVVAEPAGGQDSAALYMASLKGAVETEARQLSSPAALLERCNESSASGPGASIFVVHFDPGGRRMTYCNAGHCAPLLIDPRGQVTALDRGGRALGTTGTRYREQTLCFEEGSLLLLFTDGMLHARDEEGGSFGQRRLVRIAGLARHESAQGICNRILDELDRHRGNLSLGQDTTLLAVRASTPENDPQAPGRGASE